MPGECGDGEVRYAACETQHGMQPAQPKLSLDCKHPHHYTAELTQGAGPAAATGKSKSKTSGKGRLEQGDGIGQG